MSVVSPGGAGGGGRIALYYETLEPTVSVQAAGGRSLKQTAAGTAGSIWLKNTVTLAEELIFDNLQTTTFSTWCVGRRTTPPPSPSWSARARAPLRPASFLPPAPLAALTIKGGANVRVPVRGCVCVSLRVA